MCFKNGNVFLLVSDIENYLDGDDYDLKIFQISLDSDLLDAENSNLVKVIDTRQIKIQNISCLRNHSSALNNDAEVSELNDVPDT